jgi:hypothetical protein
MKTAITIAFDTEDLDRYDDQHLASLWHVAQANPAPISDMNAGRIAELIGREIIKRWLAGRPPALFNHQGHHHYSCALMDLRDAQRTDASP